MSIEVLSASTEAFDRGDKIAEYQTLESLQECLQECLQERLQEYVLISTRYQRVECFRRSQGGLLDS
jgi:Uma2 family endonuclease